MLPMSKHQRGFESDWRVVAKGVRKHKGDYARPDMV
jgi:hypothetical protein